MDPDLAIRLPENVARGLSPFHRLMRTNYIGVMLYVVILLSLTIQPVFSVAPLLLLLTWLGVFEVRGMQRFFDYASGLYLSVAVFCLESIFGIRIHTFGHREKFKQRSLFIMNHVCHFDWMFFWSVVERNGDLTCWKAVTKDVIKKFPILGICMQYMCNIFISRRWDIDEEEFKKKLFYYNAIDLPVQLLLFPEGGDLTLKSREKSDSYADTNELKRYEYCLHPRARGFVYVMEALRSGRLDAVYDITVGYPDALAKTEGDFVKGDYIPRDIHYNIQHYKAEDLPADEKGLTQWLADRWKEKENTLKLFYTHRHFVEVVEEGESQTRDDVSSHQNGQTEYRPVREVILPKPYLFTASAFAFYIFFITIFTYFFFLNWVWRWCVVGMAAYTFIWGLGSGIDVILPNKIHNRVEAAYNKYYNIKKTVTNIS